MGKLDDRIAVVTGAGRGIGLAIARALGREGAQVVLVARDRKRLRTAARQIGEGALAVAADVTRPGDVDRLFRIVRRKFGRLDVLVNNAGVFTYKPFARTTVKDWWDNIETNLTSIFLSARAALPLFRRSDAPHLVNVLSISSLQAFPKCSAYCAAKFGALGLTRVLRSELRAQGIRVTAVLPGTTDTRMVKAFDFPVDRARLLQPGDVADAVLGALLQPRRATVEEILLMPSSGRL
ncbi:MAG: SDR family oxidoreductase [Acidobacteria bacterium]|nr:SDR family oxidoreductase [Acidobacteriota bacterium]